MTPKRKEDLFILLVLAPVALLIVWIAMPGVEYRIGTLTCGEALNK